MRFIDCYFQLLFAAPASHPLLHPDIKRAFGHLRRFVASHMQVHGQETEPERLTRITKAREELLNFAKIAYEVRNLYQNLSRLSPLSLKNEGMQDSRCRTNMT